ncbi:MAG: sugar ABC transporter permease [Oscillospiraceae bacterium]|jgi:ABC-type sugar transport system permease subunit|nr:sugar ABC transporter permease [Oscillospiraceae bacterium]MCX4257012.1 sugar ABC transporter permease [Oscillospiraceae bacterium]
MKRLNLSYEKKKGLYGYGFIALWFVGALMFFIIPLLQSFYYSFHTVTPETGYLDIKPLVSGGKTDIFLNYKDAFLKDPNFSQYLVEVLKDMALNLPVIVVFSLFVAIVINQKFRGRTFARAVFFLPVIIATGPVYAIITGDLETGGNNEAAQFSTMFEADMVDQLLEFIGIYGFGDTFTEMLTEITSDILNLVWKCGIQIIIFLSALQGIPASAKEAAAIEGATAWEFFWKITLPYISSMILVNIVYTVIDAFIDPTNQVMERLLSVQSEWKYGYSAAMAWSYFGIILIALGIVFAIMNKLVWYDD